MEKSSIPDAWRWEGGRKLVSIILTTVYHFQRSVKYYVYMYVYMSSYVILFKTITLWGESGGGQGNSCSACRTSECKDFSRRWVHSWISINHPEFPIRQFSGFKSSERCQILRMCMGHPSFVTAGVTKPCHLIRCSFSSIEINICNWKGQH